MQHLEVSFAVRHIYIIRRLKVNFSNRQLKDTLIEYTELLLISHQGR